MPAPVTLAVAATALTAALMTSAAVTPSTTPDSPGAEPTPAAVVPAVPVVPVVPVTPTVPVVPVAPVAPVAPQAPWSWPVGSTPVPPRVTRGFSVGPYAWSAGHRGVDLSAAPGDPVRAPAAGTITFAGQVVGRAVLVISHGALRSTFEPVRASVPVGTDVAAGAAIGSVTAPGAHGGTAGGLHWGVIRGRDYLDPLTFVTFGARIRLLPWAGA